MPHAAGRLHGPGNPQVEPREVAVGRRAIASVRHLTTGSPRPQQRRRAIPPPGCGCGPSHRCSPLKESRALTVGAVANQESQAAEKQQRAGCRPPGAIRLAHLPGDAAVSPGAARLLSTWPRSRQAAPLATIPLAAASVSRCLLSGPNRCLCKHFHNHGVAALPAPGFAPKRDRCADRRASRDYRRRSGLEIGEKHVADEGRADTCLYARRPIMVSAGSWALRFRC